MIRTITLQGPFSDQDVADIADTLKRIDQRRPERMFTMVANNPDGTLKEGVQLTDLMGLQSQVMERFPDAQRLLLVVLASRAWADIRNDPDMRENIAELDEMIARLGGTDTVLYASRAYPSHRG
jgi:hypothetical protein